MRGACVTPTLASQPGHFRGILAKREVVGDANKRWPEQKSHLATQIYPVAVSLATKHAPRTHAHLGILATSLCTFGRYLTGFGGVWRCLAVFDGIDKMEHLFYSC